MDKAASAWACQSAHPLAGREVLHLSPASVPLPKLRCPCPQGVCSCLLRSDRGVGVTFSTASAGPEGSPSVKRPRFSCSGENLVQEHSPQRLDPSARPVMWPTSSLPSVADICSAPWSTLPYIPSAIREDWSRLFTSAMRQFLQTPNASTLSVVYLTSKALPAQLTRGGRTRREALLRTFRDRILLWERGEIYTLWEQLKLQNRRLSEKPHLFKSEVKELNVALPRLEHELSLRGLRLNLGKCELYAPTEVQLHPEIPTVTNPEMMDYLGVPLLPGKNRLFQTTEMKSGALTSRIRDLAL